MPSRVILVGGNLVSDSDFRCLRSSLRLAELERILGQLLTFTVNMIMQTRKRLAGRDAAVEAQMVMEDLLPR